MKTSNAAVRRPSNTRQKGSKTSYNIREHDPKFKDSTEFKRPRTVRKMFNQVILTPTGLRDAVVSLVRVSISKGNIAEYYMARTYHMEWDDEGMGDIRVYDSKRQPCINKGKILWEVVDTKQYTLNGEIFKIPEKVVEDFDRDIDNSFNTIDDFDSTF